MIRRIAKRLLNSSLKYHKLEESRRADLDTHTRVSQIYADLEHEDSSLKKNTFGLRLIGRMIKEDPKNLGIIKDHRYNTIKERLKSNIENLGPEEINDLVFWLRVLYQNNIYEVRDFNELALRKRIIELIEKKEFSPIQESELLYDYSKMKIQYIVPLNLNVRERLSNPSQEFDLGTLIQIIIAMKDSQTSMSAKIIVLCMRRIHQFSDESFEISRAIYLFKFIGELHESILKFRLIEKLLNILETNIQQMSEKDILDLLKNYNINSKTDQTLLFKIFEKVLASTNNEGRSLTTHFISKVLKSYYYFSINPDITLPDANIESILNLISERIDEFHITEIFDIFLNASMMPEYISRDLVNKILKKVESELQIEGHDFINVARSLARLCPQYPLESLVKDKEKLENSLTNLSTYHKIESIDLMGQMATLSYCSHWVDFLVKNLSEFVKDFTNARNYSFEFIKRIPKPNTMNLLASVHKQVISTFESFIEPIYAAYVLRMSISIMGNEIGEWEAFADRIKDNIDDKVIRSCIRYLEIPVKTAHLHKLFQIHRPDDFNVYLAALRYNADARPEELELLLKYFNRVGIKDLNIYKLQDYDSFFENIRLRGLSHKISDFFDRLNTALRTANLKLITSLYACSLLAKHNRLDKSLAKDIVSIHKSKCAEDFSGLLTSIASQYPELFIDKKNFIDKAVNFNAKDSIQSIIDRVNAYMLWPDMNNDYIIEKDLNRKLNFSQFHRLNVCKPWFYQLDRFRNTVHTNLASRILDEMSRGLSAAEGKLLLADTVGYLDAMSRNQHKEFVKPYNFLIRDAQKSYRKMKNDQKLTVMMSLARRGIKNQEIVQQFAKEAIQDPDLQVHIPAAFSGIAELGFHTEDWAIGLFQEALAHKPKRSDIMDWLWTLLMFSAPEKHVAEAIHMYNSVALPQYFQLRDVLIYNHFQLTQPPVPIKYSVTEQQIRSFIDVFNRFGIDDNSVSKIQNALEKKLGNVEVFKTVSGTCAPFYLPDTKTVVWPLSSSVQTYNKEHLRGGMMMHSKHLQEVSDKLVTVDLQKLKSQEGIEQWCDHLVI